jgi:hypothetical protein
MERLGRHRPVALGHKDGPCSRRRRRSARISSPCICPEADMVGRFMPSGVPRELLAYRR